MKYLIPSDFEFQLRDDIKAELDDGSTTRMDKAEKAAYTIMKDRWNKKFDIDNIFYEVKPYNVANPVAVGELVYHKEAEQTDEEFLVYEAIIASTGQSPTDTGYFEESFKRNPMVIMYLVDISNYHYQSADASGGVSEEVENRHKAAMKYVMDAASGRMDTELPLRLETDENYSVDIRYNSHPIENQRW